MVPVISSEMKIARVTFVGLIATLHACSSSPRPATTAATTPSPTAETAGGAAVHPAVAATANPADVQFVTGMISHHAQALVMAGWAPSHGASAAVRTLCERIVNGQRDEIVTMQSWLRDHGLPVPEAKPGPMMMTMGGMTHEMMMPGMLSDEQMKQLDAARGADFDRLFLTFMTQHHRGAVAMVQALFDTNGAAQEQSVFKLASDVGVDQTTEIERMQRMLAPYLQAGRAP
jgi:uncharacterized protein (DUF305 family)